jgi:hypothetical protein
MPSMGILYGRWWIHYVYRTLRSLRSAVMYSWRMRANFQINTSDRAVAFTDLSLGFKRSHGVKLLTATAVRTGRFESMDQSQTYLEINERTALMARRNRGDNIPSSVLAYVLNPVVPDNRHMTEPRQPPEEQQNLLRHLGGQSWATTSAASPYGRLSGGRPNRNSANAPIPAATKNEYPCRFARWFEAHIGSTLVEQLLRENASLEIGDEVRGWTPESLVRGSGGGSNNTNSNGASSSPLGQLLHAACRTVVGADAGGVGLGNDNGLGRTWEIPSRTRQQTEGW